MTFTPPNTRRWQRHSVDLPVRIFPSNGISQPVWPGRGSEISEGGMALYVGIHLEPGDLMEVEFEIPHRTRVAGIVRSRVGYCFGLEFLTPLRAGDTPAESQLRAPSSHWLAGQKADSRTLLQQVRKTPPPGAEIDLRKQWSAATPDEPNLDRILHDIAARALQATGATGVAIGLGRKGTMICRATAGRPIPDVGVRIKTESGLGAAAISRQMSQWCSDTEFDPRVDVEVCRQLGVRSIIVVPVRARDTVVGVFAIFSVHPDAFSLRDLMKVKDLAHRTTEAIETAIGRIAPTDDRAPAVTPPGVCPEEQPIRVSSKRTDRVQPKNYGAKIRNGIVSYCRRWFC
jgi:putative methionine-R-sulfoxide reductase with GAF domain